MSKITEKDILAAIYDNGLSNEFAPTDDLALLFPSGRMVDITEWGSHYDFVYELTDYIDYDWSSDPQDELVDDFGVITLNSGHETDDWRTKITLSQRPTQQQANELEDWLEGHWNIGDDKVFVWCRGYTKWFEKKDSTPKDIVKSIQRYFVSGILEDKMLDEQMKVDTIKLTQEQDRRVKLTDDQKQEIKQRYDKGGVSLNGLAKEYNVSKKTILLIVNDESKRKNDERIKNHWRDYYDKEKHYQAIKNTRNYKKELLQKGELKQEETLNEDIEDNITINNENINKYIQHYILSFSSDELVKESELKETTTFTHGPMFILPNGKLIDPSDYAEYEGFTKEESIHGIVSLYIIDKIFDDLGFDRDYDSEIGDEFLDTLTEKYGWIRVNSGTGFVDGRCYIVIPSNKGNKPSSMQIDKLEEWLEYIQLSTRQEDFMIATPTGIKKIYSLVNNTPKDIIKNIHRYYNTGNLYESKYTQKKLNEELKEYTTYKNTLAKDETIIPKYLYHSTTKENYKGIKESGYIGNNKNKRWNGSKDNVVYLASDKDTSIEYVKRSQEKSYEEIITLTIDTNKLDLNKLYIDENEEYWYNPDLESYDIFSFEYRDKIPTTAIVNEINENANKKPLLNYTKEVYRVGKITDDGINFFTDSLDYYDESDTGYNKEDAEKYYINLKDFKVWDPVRELNLEPNTWSAIWGKTESFDKYGIEYEYPDDDEEDEKRIWAITDTDWLAQAGKDNGYDVTIIRDIPAKQGYGNEYTEYAVHNNNAISREKTKIDESLRNKENVFDEHKSEYSYYQEYLDNPEKSNEKHKTTSQIIYMSPNEYYKELEKVFPGQTAESQKRNMESPEEQEIIKGMINTLLTTNEKLPIPYLNFAGNKPQQEGRHRMYAVGELYGWNTKFPVLEINWTEQGKKENEDEQINKIINRAIDKALQYSYVTYDEFLEELKYQVTNQFENEDKLITGYSLRETNTTYILKVNNLENMIEKDEIKIRKDNTLDDEFDWEDILSIEDMENILRHTTTD